MFRQDDEGPRTTYFFFGSTTILCGLGGLSSPQLGHFICNMMFAFLLQLVLRLAHSRRKSWTAFSDHYQHGWEEQHYSPPLGHPHFWIKHCYRWRRSTKLNLLCNESLLISDWKFIIRILFSINNYVMRCKIFYIYLSKISIICSSCSLFKYFLCDICMLKRYSNIFGTIDH